MKIIDKVSLAPMVDRTDRNFRNFIRMINDEIVLYTEMKTAQSIKYGKIETVLGFDDIQHPLVLQIAATSKEDARDAVKLAEKYDYDEINLNVGCPSDRVSGNMMGAYLMAYPEIVAEMVIEMKKVTDKPISVKNRIGIDGNGVLPDNYYPKLLDKYEDMLRFVDTVEESGVNKFIIHARIAVLMGLDPKQNRSIPPLRYDEVYRLKKDKPHLHIEINGGIKTRKDVFEHLKYVDSVMIGRELYDNPLLIYHLLNDTDKMSIETIEYEKSILRLNIIEKMIEYVEKMEKNGEKPHLFLMHTHGLFHGSKGSKEWKRRINDPKADKSTLKNLFRELKFLLE